MEDGEAVHIQASLQQLDEKKQSMNIFSALESSVGGEEAVHKSLAASCENEQNNRLTPTANIEDDKKS